MPKETRIRWPFSQKHAKRAAVKLVKKWKTEEQVQGLIDANVGLNVLVPFWKGNYGDLSLYDSPTYHANVLYDYGNRARESVIITRRKCDEWGFQPKSILDHGAGYGYTSALLGLLFPDSLVYCQDASEDHLTYAGMLFNEAGTKNVITTPDLVSADLVCSWEVLEHIEEPMPVAETIFGKAKMLSLSTSFGAPRWYGHWRKFVVKGKDIGYMAMHYHFYAWLDVMGWAEEFRGYGNKPILFTRD